LKVGASEGERDGVAEFFSKKISVTKTPLRTEKRKPGRPKATPVFFASHAILFDMEFQKKTIMGALAFAVLFAGVDLYFSRFALLPSAASQIPTEKRTVLRAAGTLLSAIVADTDALRTQGLSHRSALTETEGMLFVFDTAQKYSFWMKDMLFSIDIVWMDTNGRVVDISKSVAPLSYPKLFTPKEPAQYVLELRSGWVVRHNLKIGDVISIATKQDTSLKK
jgi:uncharacterized membrane protein (UPF0127 family)